MEMINKIIFYTHMVGISVVIVALIVLGIGYYYLKVKKITAKKENINTSYFKKEDSISYASFKNICSQDDTENGNGMIAITDTLFVGALSVKGFDFKSASASEKVDAIANSIAFFNNVEQPTTFRQSIKAVDLSNNMEMYEQTTKKLAMELMELDAERKTTLAAVDDYVDDMEMCARFKARLDELWNMMCAKQHMLDECKLLLKYMDSMSGDVGQKKNAVGERTAQILFSYNYNPDEYSEELTKEEIYIKAQEELDRIANSYAEALGSCHFKARRMSAGEVVALFYKYMHPITGDDLDIKEFFEEMDNRLFVSSDSLVKAQREKLGEEAYQRRVEEVERKMREVLKEQELARTREVDLLKQDSLEIAMREMALGGRA